MLGISSFFPAIRKNELLPLSAVSSASKIRAPSSKKTEPFLDAETYLKSVAMKPRLFSSLVRSELALLRNDIFTRQGHRQED
jgi:hypothetical protein